MGVGAERFLSSGNSAEPDACALVSTLAGELAGDGADGTAENATDAGANTTSHIMPSAQIIQFADYRQKQKPAAERLNEALRRWQMAARSMDTAGTFRASCDFYSALFENSAAARADHEKAQT